MDIRATATYQHYNQEYDFPESDPLFVTLRAIELIPEADLKHSWKISIQSGLVVRLRRRAHHPPLPSILLANVQSLDNKVDELKPMISFQRDIKDCNILCYPETWFSRDILSESVQPVGFSVHRADRNKDLSGKKTGVYVS